VLISITNAGAKERQRLVQIGLDRFALFVAGWQPEEVRTLTALLEKPERSKAAVGARELSDPDAHHHPSGRRRTRAVKTTPKPH
jgi:hypothetical protein